MAEDAAAEDAEHARAGRLGGARWARLLPALALGGVLVAYLFHRHQLDLRFPVPWPDEGSFLWQALAFRDHFSLFAPEVNPEREVLWMPPGFMVLEGLVFELVPFSLSAARTLSALFVCGALACVFAGVRRVETKLLFPLLAALCAFCPIVSMAGNVARMEGLELFVLSLAFLLLERRRGASLGVLLLAPLVHPNGIFGIAVGVPCWLLRARGRRGVMRPADWLVIGVALVAWAIYGLHISQHWADLVRDIGAQLRFKRFVSASDGGTLGRLTQPVVAGAILLLAGALVAARQTRDRLGAMGAFAAALLLQTTLAAGWLYEVYPAFAVLVTSVVSADAAFAFIAAKVPGRARLRAVAGTALAFIVVVAFAYRHNRFLERSLENSTVLRGSLAPEYFVAADREAIERYLESLVPPDASRPLSVQFLPDADALLFEKERRPRLDYVQQTFYEHRYDVLLVHESAWFPPFVRNLELIKLLWAKGGAYETRVVYERDGSERWTAYSWPR